MTMNQQGIIQPRSPVIQQSAEAELPEESAEGCFVTAAG